jgi:hypothetical protein
METKLLLIIKFSKTKLLSSLIVNLASASAAAAIGVATTVRDEEDCQDVQDQRRNSWNPIDESSSSRNQFQVGQGFSKLFCFAVFSIFLQN